MTPSPRAIGVANPHRGSCDMPNCRGASGPISPASDRRAPTQRRRPRNRSQPVAGDDPRSRTTARRGALARGRAFFSCGALGGCCLLAALAPSAIVSGGCRRFTAAAPLCMPRRRPTDQGKTYGEADGQSLHDPSLSGGGNSEGAKTQKISTTYDPTDDSAHYSMLKNF